MFKKYLFAFIDQEYYFNTNNNDIIATRKNLETSLI